MHTSVDANLFQRGLKRQGVHDGGQHADIVGARPFHAAFRQGGPAENIAATHDEADLDTGAYHLTDVLGHRLQGLGINSELTAANAGFPRELPGGCVCSEVGRRAWGIPISERT